MTWVDYDRTWVRLKLGEIDKFPLIFRYTALILLATRILAASPNFGLEQHDQKAPSATFCKKKCIWSPMCSHHVIFYNPSQYPFSWPNGRLLPIACHTF